MRKKDHPKRLTRISEAKTSLIADWQEGESLRADFGEPIDNLLIRVAAARWRLASEHLRDANLLFKTSRPVYRSTISRYYYAMYHAFRAAAFLHYKGDDHQGHTDLALNLPRDLPDRARWTTNLKEARLNRNRADYEPYPRNSSAWRSTATQLRTSAIAAIAATRAYLRSKGCKL